MRAHGIDIETVVEVVERGLVVARYEDREPMEHPNRLIITDRDRPDDNPLILPARSFNRNLLCHIWVYKFGISGYYLNQNGTPAWPIVNGGNIIKNSGTNYGGLQLGTSDTPFNAGQVSLQSLILHGSSAGQLIKGSGSVSSLTNDGSTAYFDYTRNFTNSSGGTVTVKEAGMMAAGAYDSAGDTAMLMRDVLPSPVEIQSGYGKRVTYRVGIVANANKTFTRNLIMWLKTLFNQETHQFYDTGGTLRSGYGSVMDNNNSMAGEGVTNYGVRLGTNADVCSLNDNGVKSLVPHGTSLGQLFYYAMNQNQGSFTGPTMSGENTYVIFYRCFENMSSSPITVKEYDFVTPVPDYYGSLLRGRINNGNGITLNPGAWLKFNIKLKT